MTDSEPQSLLEPKRCLRDILVCPLTKAPLELIDGALQAKGGPRYEPVRGVPSFLPVEAPPIEHEGELHVWDDYVPTILAMLRSIPARWPILDLGSGNRAYDDPQIIRMDVVWTPHVDVIGDAHALPFADDSIGLVYASAVFEHLRQPFQAASEIWRVLRPGGYALVDCNFVFPFHGYPAVYFNASADGMRQLFHQFREMLVMAAPWQLPSFGIRAIFAEYRRLFRSRGPRDDEFLKMVDQIIGWPWQDFDGGLDQAAAQRIAAATTYLGIKQPKGSELLWSEDLESRWNSEPELRARYPDPARLIDPESLETDNLLLWHRQHIEAHGAAPANPIAFQKGRVFA